MADKQKNQNAGKASNSKNKKANSTQSTKIDDVDEVSLGPVLNEKQQGIASNHSGKFALQWKDINFKVLAHKTEGVFNTLSRWISDEEIIKKDQQILTNSCGYVKQGELVAIIGPSGGGKTTLLNVLARRYNMLSHKEFSMNGSITLNNKDLTRQLVMDYGSFLEQDDLLSDSNTPRELIYESAIMRTNLPKQEAKARTERLL